MKWRELAEEGKRQVGDSVRFLLEDVSGESYVDVLKKFDVPVSQLVAKRFFSMLERLEAGEPLQYVLEGWGFRGLDLYLDSRVLIPRPETEVVVDVALSELGRLLEAKVAKSTAEASEAELLLVADLGCGSGAIGLSIATECPQAKVICTDISEDALSVTRANVCGLGMAATGIELAQGSWFEALDDSLKASFDLIVSNPPYVANSDSLPEVVSEYEPHQALFAGPKGTEQIFAILQDVSDWLVPGGSVVLEITPHQADFAEETALAHHLVAPQIHTDLTGRPRVFSASKP